MLLFKKRFKRYKDIIVKKAENLRSYLLKDDEKSKKLLKFCTDVKLLEAKCMEFNQSDT